MGLGEIEMENANEVKELITLANAAKTANDYETANLAFAKLFNVYQCMDSWGFKDNEDAHLVAGVETQDDEGSCLDEAYYDLAVINYDDSEAEISLCIPTPLLSPMAIASFYKAADYTDERHQSRREHIQEEAAETENRRARIIELCGGEYQANHLREVYLVEGE